jgi:hypothetical protein
MLQLGSAARDKITGFEGILTARAEYLYGCNQFCIVPAARDGKCGDAQWFDEGRVEVTGPGVSAASVRADRPGGPNRDAPR